MKPKLTIHLGFIGALAILAGSTSAGVTMLTRLSSVTQFQDLAPSPPIGYEANYNENATYAQFGDWTVTLPHGASHTSSVTGGSASGSFQSNYYAGSVLGSTGVLYAKKSSLAVEFAVANRSTTATIDMDGYCIVLRNAYVTICNKDTNQLVFDSIDHGVAASPGNFDGLEMRWSAVRRIVELGTGNYRLLMGADFQYTFHPGPGQGNQANGNLNATVSFLCEADFNADNVVDDADFTIFVVAYITLLCEDPEMTVGCPSDLNGDGFVDDADFQLFGHAYDQLVCP